MSAKKLVWLLGAVAALLVACGPNHHPVPPDGIVTDHAYVAGHMNIIPAVPGVMTCTKYGCSTSPGMPMQMYWVPDEWTLEITATHNPDWKGNVDVNEHVYALCPIASVWPNCSTDHSIREAGRP